MSKIGKVFPVCGSNIALEEESIDGVSAVEICPKSGTQWKSSENEQNPDISLQNTPSQEKSSVKNKKRRPSLWQYFVWSVTKKFVDCSGRASRREFWGTMLFLTIFILFVQGYTSLLATYYIDLGFGWSGFWVLQLDDIIYYVIFFSLCMRRIHDLGHKGKILGTLMIISRVLGLCIDSFFTKTYDIYYFTPSLKEVQVEYLWFVYSPEVALFAICSMWIVYCLGAALNILFLVFGCIKGQTGINEFGPDPLEQDSYLIPDVSKEADDYEGKGSSQLVK